MEYLFALLRWLERRVRALARIARCGFDALGIAKAGRPELERALTVLGALALLGAVLWRVWP